MFELVTQSHPKGITMATITHPDLPVPAGAYVLSDWDEADNEYRIISTAPKEVEGTDVGVSVDAPQLRDGSLISRPRLNPIVRVDSRSTNPNFKWDQCLELSIAGARQVARALLEAADQLDGWDGTKSA
jgi:hypothetical protein